MVFEFEQSISTHSPRVGRDLPPHPIMSIPPDFNPLSPCGERLQSLTGKPIYIAISTHSPRVGRDNRADELTAEAEVISTHSPRVGRDLASGSNFEKVTGFQPTLPVWGETKMLTQRQKNIKNFNPLSPCGERPVSACLIY